MTRALFRHRYRLIARVLLAMTLLIAQSGAEAHAYSHLVQSQPDAPATTQGCGECLSCAPLLTSIGGSQSVILLPRFDDQQLVSSPSIPVSCVSRPSSFQSRAPPDLL